MTEPDERLELALAEIDRANMADPNMEMDGGEEKPKVYLYGLRMTGWLEKLAPDASDALRVAARAQHIERWTVPRNEFPMGVKGYNQWRTGLRKFHAKRAGEIMAELGYGEETIQRTGDLLQKKHLKKNAETQMLEDVVCMVFLEFEFDHFAAKHEEEKLIDIVQKTWGKMSKIGHEAALGLEMSPEGKRLIGKALA